MSQNKFNEYGGTVGDVLTNGSVDIFAYSLRASNLDANQPLKTNATKTLYSSKLDINDINNLQAELDSTIQTPYTGGDFEIVNGDLNMNNNSIKGVFQINVDQINERTTGNGIYTDNTLYTRDIIVTDSHKIKTDTIEETTLTGGVTIMSDVHMNNKNIDDIATLTASTLISTGLETSMIQNQTPATPIDIASSLNLLSVSIIGASNISTTTIDCDTINPLSGVNITLNGDLDMNTTYGITNVNGIDTNTILTDTIGEKTISGGVSVLDSALTITNINVPALAEPLLKINSNYISNPSTIKLKTDIHEGYTLQTADQMITASSTNILIQSDDDEIKLSTGGGIKSLIIDNSLSSVKIQDYNLNMNGNIIENVEEIKTNNLTISTGGQIFVNNSLNLNNNSIIGGNEIYTGYVKTNQIRPNENIDPNNISVITPTINYNVLSANFNGQPSEEILQNYTRQGTNWGTIGTNPTEFYISNFNNSAVDIALRGVTSSVVLSDTTGNISLTTSGGTKKIVIENPNNWLKLYNLDLDMNNRNIKRALSVDTREIKNMDDFFILVSSDLDFQNAYNLRNIASINDIRPSGGLYSQSNLTQFTQTVETNMLGGPNNAGSLTIPANTFKELAVYSFKSSGILAGGSNDLFNLRLKSGVVVFADLAVTIDDNGLTGNWWDLTADFSINTIGVAGVAVLVTSVVFRYINNTNVVKTRAVSNINNTTFDTTISNTLSLTFQNDATNPLTFLQMNAASFTQWY